MKVKIILFSLIVVLLLGAIGVGMYYTLPYRYDNAENYQSGATEVDATAVNAVQIHWINGFITLEYYDGDTLSVQELNAPDAQAEQMWTAVSDGVLDIRYCKSGTLSKGARKQLKILLPKEKTLDLTVTTKTANLVVNGGSFGKITIDNATGLSRFYHTEAREISCVTDSGDVNYNGTLVTGKFETVSGNHALTYTNTPDTLAFYSVDGEMQLALPDKAAFVADFYTKDGTLTSAFEGTVDENRLTVGNDPTAKFDIVTVSGNLKINRK